MGLLDQFGNMNEEQTQGLLAAASQMLQQSGPSRTPTGFGQVLGGGLEAFQGSMQAARKRKLMEAEAAQMAQYRGLQMNGMQGDLQDSQAARAQKSAIQAAARGSMRTPEQMAASLPGGPTIANAARIPSMEDGFDQGDFIRKVMAIDPMKGLALAQQFKKQGTEYGTDVKVGVGPDGKPFSYLIGKDGTQKRLDGTLPRDEMKLADLGNRKEAYNPFALQPGQKLQMGVDPSTVYTGGITMRGQDKTDLRARDLNAIGVEANNIKRAEKKETLDMTKNSQVASFDTMLGTLGRLGKHPGLSKSVGLAGALPTMPGSESANFQAELDTFQSQAFIPMVAQLKGMGALSDAEGKKLTAAVGALNPKMGETAFKESLGRITTDMESARARVSGQASAPPKPDIPRDAINMLKMNPKLREQFDAKYGAGASASALGK